jgi:hypothetical protein
MLRCKNNAPGGMAVRRGGAVREGRASFLEKRSKKLFVIWGMGGFKGAVL